MYNNIHISPCIHSSAFDISEANTCCLYLQYFYISWWTISDEE